MDSPNVFLSLPATLELWIILAYVTVILAAARVTEKLARMHFGRARQYSEQGFTYHESWNHYRCPVGERLTLHAVDAPNRLTVYRAPASTCRGCPLKKDCTPHEEARAIFRSSADWAETDMGWFHRGLSILMFAAGSLLCANRLWWRGGEPGTGLLALALLICVACLARELSRFDFSRSIPRNEW